MKTSKGAWSVWGAILLGLFAAATASGSISRVVLLEDFDSTA